MIADLIRGKIDILLISETNVDSTFPSPQFEIHGYTSPFRLDRSRDGGGLLLYTKQDIPTMLLPSQHFGKIQCVILEINISNKRWLLLEQQPSYDNIILLGAFNSETSEHHMVEFCNSLLV